jgi:hypothetical protein
MKAREKLNTFISIFLLKLNNNIYSSYNNAGHIELPSTIVVTIVTTIAKYD